MHGGYAYRRGMNACFVDPLPGVMEEQQAEGLWSNLIVLHNGGMEGAVQWRISWPYPLRLCAAAA